MKIAYIANLNSIHSKKWIEYFENKGHTVESYDTTLGISSIKYCVEQFHPDILHAHYAGLNGFIGALCNYHPYIITVWGSDVIANYKNIFKRQLVKYGLNKADLITCDAEHIMGCLSRYGVKPSKIKRINFGVDTGMFKPDKIKHSGKVVVSLRSLDKVYDVQTLIRAVPYVVKEIDDVVFKIYGDGTQREYLEKLASKLGVSDYVEFCGKVEYNEIPKILNSSDLYVSTALSDAGIASSTAEAMACGIYCIDTNCADNKYWANDQFTPRNFEELSNYIISFLGSPRVGRIISQSCVYNRKLIVEKDNYLIEMGKMEQLYEECLNNSKS